MGLKLKIGKGDKIIMDCGVVIDLIFTSPQNGGEATLEIEAPNSISIHTIFLDSSKQFKNMKRDQQ